MHEHIIDYREPANPPPVSLRRRTPRAPAPTPPKPRARTRERVASEITKRHIEWLWRPYLQARAINLLTGDPGSGKSTIVCELVAALTTGRPLPGDDEPREPINCWMLNGEDAADDTIVWRLENQGADLSRVIITDQQDCIDSGFIKEMYDVVADYKIGLIVIDPLQAWMGSGVDMNDAAKTRQWAGHLRAIAMKTGAAILFVRHKRKAQVGADIYAGLGSIDITGFARSEISTSTIDEQRVLSRIKGNIGLETGGLAYIITPSPDRDNDHGVLQWRGRFNKPARNGRHAPGHRANPGTDKPPSQTPRALQAAIDWLTGQLSSGPQAALKTLDAGIALGFSESTVRRALRAIGHSRQLPDATWQWALGPAPAELMVCK